MKPLPHELSQRVRPEDRPSCLSRRPRSWGYTSRTVVLRACVWVSIPGSAL